VGLTFAEFEARCVPGALANEDSALRTISSPEVPGYRAQGRFVTHEDLAYVTAWPFVVRAITGRFPWEL